MNTYSTVVTFQVISHLGNPNTFSHKSQGTTVCLLITLLKVNPLFWEEKYRGLIPTRASLSYFVTRTNDHRLIFY